MRKRETYAPPVVSRPSIMAEHPLHYLGNIKAKDARGQISAVMEMPYPADPLVEPEYVGLTYYQVALIRQAELAARHSSLDSLTF